MAKVTITIEDVNEGTEVNLIMESDPPFPVDIKNATNAQLTATMVYTEIRKSYKEWEEGTASLN